MVCPHSSGSTRSCSSQHGPGAGCSGPISSTCSELVAHTSASGCSVILANSMYFPGRHCHRRAAGSAARALPLLASCFRVVQANRSCWQRASSRVHARARLPPHRLHRLQTRTTGVLPCRLLRLPRAPCCGWSRLAVACTACSGSKLPRAARGAYTTLKAARLSLPWMRPPNS